MITLDDSSLIATKDHVIFAFDVLVSELAGGSLGLRPQPPPGPNFGNAVAPLFITWNKSNISGEVRLRGCIGTLEPKKLHAAVRDYALTSALRDRRFDPVERHELPYLSCTVSLLRGFEAACHGQDWDLGTHGLLLEFADPSTRVRRTATFLPEVAPHQRWDKAQTMEHLLRKAGYGGAWADVEAAGAWKLTRYQSTTCTLSYSEYLCIKEGEGAGAQQQQQGHGFRVGWGQRRLVTVPA